MLFELEKQYKEDVYELTTGLLFEKHTQTSLTINTLLVYGWAKDIQNECETEWRPNYSDPHLPALQPSIEIDTGGGFWVLAPVL